MTLDKPLSENAMASVNYGMRVASKADHALYDIEQELKRCKVSVDSDSFKHARFYLEKIYAGLTPIPLANAEAVIRGRK